MDIRDFIARLRVQSGPSETGEYKCVCPAHDDRRASLSVNVGDKGIIFKCHAGCSKEAVLQAMGLTVSDLMDRPSQALRASSKALSGPSGQLSTANSTQPFIPHSGQAGSRQRESQGGHGDSERREIDTVYSYTDENGNELFEVVRFIPKDFRQRVKDPTAKGGYRWSIKGVRPVVYRLPEVRKAIAAGRMILVVEGEKDADNMAALGITATTSPMGAGKWRPEHSEQLAGADVAIVPDNDHPGAEHARKVADSLQGVAKSVRILDIASACPGLPEKGDITDFFHILGRDTGLKTLDALIRSTEPEAAREKTDAEVAAEQFGKIVGYCVEDGCICQMNDGVAKRLCTFTALPKKIITRDDGTTVDKVFEIAGWTRGGRALPTVRVKASDFPSLGWVLQNGDFSANIMPGSTVKDKLRYAITEAGEAVAERETVYTHTGWRQMDGGWAYLHQGGAIGGDAARVELDSALSGYTMDGGDEISYIEASLSWTVFRDAMAAHISVPMLGLCYLAPLREFLKRGHCAPHFILFLRGGSGTHKSTATVLALNHFGVFDIDSLPATFHDTRNAIRTKAFMLKDCLLAIDDYHPESSPQERKRMEATAQDLARAFGDGADRGRLQADLTLQANKQPRCLALMSGEDLPNIGESGVARLYVIDVGPRDIAISDQLEVAQELARQGYFRKAMRGYIAWLGERGDDLAAQLPDMYYKLRTKARREGKGLHGRAPEAIAHIMLGYRMMLEYIADIGGMTREQADGEFASAWKIILDNAETQGRESLDDRPTRQFLNTISELIASRAVSVRNLADPKSGDPGVNGIGYCDGSYYYLLPDQAFARVSKLYKDQGSDFMLTKRGLYKQLKDDGLIELDADGKATRVKAIDGKSVRLLWVPRSRIDRGEPPKPPVQTAMDFEEVSDDEIPPFTAAGPGGVASQPE